MNFLVYDQSKASIHDIGDLVDQVFVPGLQHPLREQLDVIERPVFVVFIHTKSALFADRLDALRDVLMGEYGTARGVLATRLTSRLPVQIA